MHGTDQIFSEPNPVAETESHLAIHHAHARPPLHCDPTSSNDCDASLASSQSFDTDTTITTTSTYTTDQTSTTEMGADAVYVAGGYEVHAYV